MKARWAKGKTQRNTELCFVCTVGQYASAELAFIAKDVYNLYVNGVFVCYGPARAAKHYARVERIDLSGYLTQAENTISVYVQSNYTKTLCFALEEPLFAAELTVEGKVVVDTDGFVCYEMTDKLKAVERMSSQRGYVEVYQMQKDREPFDKTAFPVCETEERACPKLLERNVGVAKHTLATAALVEEGGVTVDPSRVWENDFTRQLDTGNNLFSYTRAECDCVLSKEALSFVFEGDGKESGLRYESYAFDRTQSGKFSIKLTAKTKTTVWLVYDDILIDGKLKFNREQIIHALKWELEAGDYLVHSGEVYVAKFVTLVLQGDCAIDKVQMIRVENPHAERMQFTCEDKDLQAIVEASRHSFEHNGYDLLTDCPSRERAGYLCDGFFAARAEGFFCGEYLVEKNLLENYLSYTHEHFVHEGILPMCYPSEPKAEDDYIPNWVLWYVLQVEDYLLRTGDEEFVSKHKKQIQATLEYFKTKENEYGLLEDLDGWVFVEWSKANDFVNGVNFPSNMCYYGALRAAARLLGDEEIAQKAERLKKTIIEMSYNGAFFVDNAVRVDGKLQITDNISETCQNYAAFFDIFTREENPQFYNRLIHELGCIHREEKHAGVYASNMFIGYILRLSVLLREGAYAEVLEECKNRFADMAYSTGTIWELFQTNASCNHGFGSVVGQMIVHALAGIVRVDERTKTVYLTKEPIWIPCKVCLPLLGGSATVIVEDGRREFCLPDGYQVQM